MSGSKRTYPPQTGAYAVKVKNGSGWSNYDVARLQISVGQDYHEGAKLEATLNWANDRFKRIIVCVNDTLQRFNHMFEDGLSADEAYHKALRHGEEWLERNSGLLEACGNLDDADVHRWDDWRARPDFAERHAQIMALYNDNAEFRAAVDRDVKDFWARRQKRASLTDQHGFAEFHAHSSQYLLEETAAFSLMFEEEQAADIYPGTLLLPCRVFKNRNIDGIPPGLIKGTHNTRIDFRRQTPKKPTAVPVLKVA